MGLCFSTSVSGRHWKCQTCKSQRKKVNWECIITSWKKLVLFLIVWRSRYIPLTYVVILENTDCASAQEKWCNKTMWCIKVLRADQQSLLRIEVIFALIEMDDLLKKYMIMKTHKSLSQCNRLVFCTTLSAAPGRDSFWLIWLVQSMMTC